MEEEVESLSLSTSMDSREGKLEQQTPAPVGKTRRLGDWLDSFLESTEDAASPKIFRLWAGITAISAAAERRVWTTALQGDVWPNLYVLLVAPPAVGKGQAITPVEHIWHKAKGQITGRIKVAPHSMTKASMIDELAKAQRTIPLNKFAGTEGLSVDILQYASLTISAEELGVLVFKHDLEFLSTLTALYNDRPSYSETRRTNSLSIEVFNPQVTLLAGTQPAFLANLLPEEAWGMGTMSRIIMIYAGTPIKKGFFPVADNVVSLRQRALRSSLELDMGQILDLYGRFTWEDAAAREFESWLEADMPPAPVHSKLIHYNGRRRRHIAKLAMVASLSRGNDLQVTLSDFNRAKDWLLDAEIVMPDVFREMTGKSDGQLIKELNFFMFAMWVRSGRKPLPTAMLYNFLQSRTTADRIERIIQTAERANIIAREAGTDTWIPRPADEHGVE